MIGPEEPIVLEQYSLGEIIFDRLNSREDKNLEYLVDISKNVNLSCQDILQYSVNLTLNLEKLGVRQNDVLGLFSENCWESALTILAAWNLGAAVAFINPNFIKSELFHSLKIKQPKILFTTKDKLEMLQENVAALEGIILYDQSSENGYFGFQSLLFANKISYQNYRHKKINSTDSVACIMSSSGTTGLPKAVMLTQDNLKWCIKYMSDPNTININPETITLLYLPLFHIMGLMIFLGIVNAGKKLLIVNKFRPEQFLATLQNYKVNSLFVVPPILGFLAKNSLVPKFELSSVRHILCGGAPASKDIEVDVTNRLSNAKVRQIYGMTEVSGAVTAVPVNESRYGSVGKPFKGLQIKIVDPKTNETLGANKRGEICIRGPAVMKGYMKNLEETKNCIDREGYMHSGDIGYCDVDGFIFVVDRIKELIKYKAFQVAPAEIERFIIKHKAVKDVGIVGKPDDRCGELPTAFVVKQPEERVTERDILDFVADNFSHEKHLHGGVYFVDEIPKTPSGKILRRELRKLLPNVQ